MRLPDDVRESALEYAYEKFDRCRWERIPASERGGIFDELVADYAFSGPLRPYLTEGQIRVWLKDSAAKEYGRALEGIGGTAQFTPRRYPGPDAIARSVLGDEWSVVAGSIEQKPMRCEVRGPRAESVTLLWGPLRGLRDMHWAASRIRALGSGRVAIAVTRPSMTLPPADDWRAAKLLCELIEVDLFSVMYVPRVVPAEDSRAPLGERADSVGGAE